MKYTKGPWYPVFEQTICIGVSNSPDGYMQMICNSILPNTDDEYEKESGEIEANMNLISSAPELLEALEACKVTLEAFLPEAFATLAVVKSAIDKAKKS